MATCLPGVGGVMFVAEEDKVRITVSCGNNFNSRLKTLGVSEEGRWSGWSCMPRVVVVGSARCCCAASVCGVLWSVDTLLAREAGVT